MQKISNGIVEHDINRLFALAEEEGGERPKK